MIEHLLELLLLLGPIPFLLGQIQIDELFFDLVVKGGEGANAQIQRFTGSLQKVEPAGTAAGKGVDRFGRSATSAQAASTGLGTILKRLVGLFGGLFIIRRVVSAMTKFQTTMAEVATITGGGAEQVEELTRATLSLSREVPQTAEELGAGAYQILSAGVKDTADILLILEASSKAAVAGLTETEVAVDAVTTILNAFQLQADQANRVADVLFRTVEDGKLRFDTIAASIGTAATSAALAGVEFEELTAGMAVLTQRGLDAAVATTALNRLFLTATDKSTEQAEAFERLNLEFTTSAIKADGFATVLGRVQEATGGDIDALAELFTEQRAARAAFILAGAGADDFTEALDRARNATGAAERAFETMNQTAINQGRILRNQVIVTFQEIGLTILPGVSKAFEFISFAISNFVGTIKVLGAEAPVAFQRLRVGVIGALQAIDEFALDAIRAIDTFFEGLAERLRVIAGLPIPGAEIAGVVAAGFEAVGRGLDNVVMAQERAISTRAEQLEQEKENLRFLEEGFQETVLLIAAEQEFLRTRRQRAEETEAANERERQARQLTQEQLEERRELELEVLDEVAKATQSAAELQARAFLELGDRVKKIFGDEIPQSVADGLATLGEVVEAAVLEEAAMRLAESFRIAIEEEFAEIEFATIAITEEEERRAEILARQTAVLQDQRAAVEARLAATKAGTAEEKALRAVLVEIVKLLREAGEEQGDLAKEAKRDAQERARALQATLSLIQQGINGVTDLAAEFGIVDDETRDIIDNMLQLGTAIGTVISQIQAAQAGAAAFTSILAGGLGIVGALGGLIGGLFGGGPDPETVARQRILRDNTEKLEDLRQSVEKLRGTFELTGAQVARALQQLLPLEDVTREIAELITELEEQGGIFEELIPDIIEDFQQRLMDLGVDMQNLDRVAEEFGITLRDEAGNIIPAALVQLIEALEEVEDNLIGFADTIEGAFARLRAEFEIFDVEDPIEKFQRLQAALLDIQVLDPEEVAAILADESLNFLQKMNEIAKALQRAGANVTPFLQELLAIDVGTPEGREAADRLIRDIFQQLAEGRITPEELGAATFDEAVQILLEMEGLLDEIAEQEEEGVEEEKGQTQDIRRTVQITELQANQLLAFQSTLVVRAEQRNRLLEAILEVISGRAVEPPPPPPPPQPDGPIDGRLFIQPPAPGGVPLIENVNVDSEISVGEGVNREQLEEAREILVEDLAEELGERLAEEERLVGLPRISRQRID